MAHTKCISEAEKYSGKDYVPKASQNKGQRKQEAWTEMIEKVLSRKDLSHGVRSTLNLLTKHENVPRKRPKFANFMKNISRGTSPHDLNQTFDLIEEAFKAEKDEQQSALAKEKEAKSSNGCEAVKRKVDKEEVTEEAAEELPKKKKKKKDDTSVVVEKDEETLAENGDSGELKTKKKKKKKGKTTEESNGTTTEEAAVENGKAQSVPEPGFCWKETIRGIVAEKGNSVSIKKLQAKLLKAYKKQAAGDTETVNEQTIDVVLKRKLKKMKNISIEDDQVVVKV